MEHLRHMCARARLLLHEKSVCTGLGRSQHSSRAFLYLLLPLDCGKIVRTRSWPSHTRSFPVFFPPLLIGSRLRWSAHTKPRPRSLPRGMHSRTASRQYSAPRAPPMCSAVCVCVCVCVSLADLFGASFQKPNLSHVLPSRRQLICSWFVATALRSHGPCISAKSYRQGLPCASTQLCCLLVLDLQAARTASSGSGTSRTPPIRTTSRLLRTSPQCSTGVCVCVCMYGCMDAWMYVWMNGWM